MNPAILDAIRLVLSTVDTKEEQDRVLDFFEDFIGDTETQIDDQIFLPLFRAIRQIGNIPDKD
jgi:hypothetical protein